MRFALVNLLDRKFDLGEDFDMENMFGLIPNRDGEGMTQPWKTPDNYRFRGRPDVPFVVASHLRWEVTFGELPAVFLVRNPGDVVVSRYHHMTSHEGKFSGSLADFVNDPEWGLPDLLGYLESWAPHLDDSDTTVVTYEALKTDPTTAFGRLVEGLGIEAGPGELEAALEAASVDRMRRVEAASGVGQPQSYDFEDPNARRVRKAKVGSWREEMDDDTIALMLAEIELFPAVAEMLDGLGIRPGAVSG